MQAVRRLMVGFRAGTAKRTALYDIHKANKGKMIEFAGRTLR